LIVPGEEKEERGKGRRGEEENGGGERKGRQMCIGMNADVLPPHDSPAPAPPTSNF